MNNLRTTQLQHWLENVFSCKNIDLKPLTGDAGFRRYFRFQVQNKSYIAVDAPVNLSNNHAFMQVQAYLLSVNVNVPQIMAKDLTAGFLCLTDFGNTLLADELSQDNMQQYYLQATSELEKINLELIALAENLPAYDDAFIATELMIFKEWLLEAHLGIYLSKTDNNKLKACFDFITCAMLEQPKVFMHRDYHSRNIMLIENNALGIIDFQDAVKGPVTYDLVSLLRDCYIKWPDDLISPIIDSFRQRAQSYFPNENLSQEKWQYWFDLTGLQRHLKASGIFARLHHRDQKSNYLADIPLTLTYIQDISGQYDKLNFIHELVTNRVIPAVNAEREK